LAGLESRLKHAVDEAKEAKEAMGEFRLSSAFDLLKLSLAGSLERAAAVSFRLYIWRLQAIGAIGGEAVAKLSSELSSIKASLAPSLPPKGEKEALEAELLSAQEEAATANLAVAKAESYAHSLNNQLKKAKEEVATATEVEGLRWSKQVSIYGNNYYHI